MYYVVCGFMSLIHVWLTCEVTVSSLYNDVCARVCVCGIQLQYRLSAVSSNPNAIREPSFSIAKIGRIPTRLSGRNTSSASRLSAGYNCHPATMIILQTRPVTIYTKPLIFITLTFTNCCLIGNQHTFIIIDDLSVSDSLCVPQ